MSRNCWAPPPPESESAIFDSPHRVLNIHLGAEHGDRKGEMHYLLAIRRDQCERARHTASDQRLSSAVLVAASVAGVNTRSRRIIRAASSGLENSPAPRPASIAAPRAV